MALTDPTSTLRPQSHDLRSLAVHRLQRKREFRGHLAVYGAVNALLVAIWLVAGVAGASWFPWPVFPLAGWGVGLAAHGWATYGPPSRPFTDDDVDRELERLARRRS